MQELRLNPAWYRPEHLDFRETVRRFVAREIAPQVAARTMQFCADAAVRTLGGMGYVRGTRAERIYREVKVNMIGGGAEEFMKDLAARQLGL